MHALALPLLALLIAPQQPSIPRPVGMVNDFAGVIGADHAARIERIVQYVRDRSRGEIAVVTMRDIGGREVNDIALRIGRDWGVGANAPPGDRARNAGVVVLLVPKETASDGRGQIAVEVGQGAEGFIPDGVAGDIWRASTPALSAADYGAALEQIVYRIADRYADEFGFSMDSIAALRPRDAPQRVQTRGVSPRMIVVLLVMAFLIMSAAASGGRAVGADAGGIVAAAVWAVRCHGSS